MNVLNIQNQTEGLPFAFEVSGHNLLIDIYKFNVGLYYITQRK